VLPINSAIQNKVVVKDYSLSFDDKNNVLDEINFDVKDGEFISLVGPSGCGKTTLLNLLAGIVPLIGSGDIKINGEDPEIGSTDVAYMLARDSLFPWRTALGNAGFGMEARGALKEVYQPKALKMLSEVGLKDFANAYPKELSHGMRQRVALARTFSLDAQLLLMDEPFGALDAQTKLQLEDLLLSLCHQFKHTVVFVTHDLAEAVALSDRVLVMSSRPGKIIADISIDLPRPRSIRELQKSQKFHELYSVLWTYLEEGWVRHEG